MNLLAAIFVAGVGLYTIYCAPRSWPHWLAGCAALGFVVVDRLFPIDGYSRGVGFTVIAALLLSAGGYLVTGSARNLRWVVLSLVIGLLPTLSDPQADELINVQLQNLTCLIVCVIVIVFLFLPQRYSKSRSYIAALLAVCFLGAILDSIGFLLFYSVLYLMPVWGGTLLLYSTPKHNGPTEIMFWRSSLISIGVGFVLAMLEFRENFVIDDVSDSRFPPSFPNNNPVLTELSAWLPPLLVAIGIVATCFAIVRLVPPQPDAQPETPEPSDLANPL